MAWCSPWKVSVAPTQGWNQSARSIGEGTTWQDWKTMNSRSRLPHWVVDPTVTLEVDAPGPMPMLKLLP